MRFLTWILALFVLIGGFSGAGAYEGDDIGLIDAVTVNGRHFEDLDRNQIVFYKDQLKDGRVVIKGILEPEAGKNLQSIAVQVTLDGGKTWQPVTGLGNWSYSFFPEPGRPYDFALRVVPVTSSMTVPTAAASAPVALGDSKSTELDVLIGEFRLKMKGASLSQEIGISGPAAIDPTWLKPFLGAEHLNSDGLAVNVSGLKLDATRQRVVEGEANVFLHVDVPVTPTVVLSIRSISFTPQGAKVSAIVSVRDGFSIPDVPLHDAAMTSQGIVVSLIYRPQVARVFEILRGSDFIRFMVRGFDLNIDTAAHTCSISGLDAGLVFSGRYFAQGGTAKEFLVAKVGETYAWGSAVRAEGDGPSLLIPATAISIRHPGGTIQPDFSGITLSGEVEIPFYGQVLKARIPQEGLSISTQGFRTPGMLQLTGFDPQAELDSFVLQVAELGLELRDGVVGGCVSGTMALKGMGVAEVAYTADISADGVRGLRAALPGRQSINIAGFAKIDIDRLSIGYGVDTGLRVSMDGQLNITRSDIKSQVPLPVIPFSGLSFDRRGIALPPEWSGWRSLFDPVSLKLPQTSLDADAFGIGVDSAKGLWAGLKGAMQGNLLRASASVRAFADGSLEIGDLQANGEFRIGAFTLYTDARYNDGQLTGRGKLVSDFTAPDFPAGLKDPSGHVSLDVEFDHLTVDPQTLRVTAGAIEVPFPEAVAVGYEGARLSLETLIVTASEAVISGRLALSGLEEAGDIEVDRLTFSADGLSGRIHYEPATPMLFSMFTAPRNIDLVIRSLSAEFRSSPKAFTITDFDASVNMGAAYDAASFAAAAKNGVLEWGASASDAARKAGQEAAAALPSIRIPDTDAFIQAPGGHIELQPEPRFFLHGTLVLPGMDDISVELPARASLIISRTGVSSSGPVTVSGLDVQKTIEGFAARIREITAELKDGVLTAAVKGQILIAMLRDMPVSVHVALNGQGISGIDVAAEASGDFNIANFAAVSLKRVSGAWSESSGFYIDCDADFVLNSGKIGEAQATARTFALRGLRFYKDAVAFAEGIPGWHALSPAVQATVDGLSMSVDQWGVGERDGILWLGIGADSSAGASTGEVKAKGKALFFVDGRFETQDVEITGNAEYSFGIFKLTTTAAIRNGRLSGSGRLTTSQPVSSLVPRALVDQATGQLNAAVEFADLVVAESRNAAGQVERRVTDGSIAILQQFDATVKDIDLAVQKIIFSAQGVSLEGKLTLTESISGIDLPEFDFRGLSLDMNGPQGVMTLEASWPVPQHIDIFPSKGFGMDLSAIRLSLDWNKSGVEMVSVSDITATLNPGQLFDALAQAPVFSFVGRDLKVSVPSLRIPATSIELVNPMMNVNIFARVPTVSLPSVTISIPFFSSRISLVGTNVSLTESGLSGSFAALPNLTIDSLGIPITVNTLSLGLNASGIVTSSVDLRATLAKLNNLSLVMGASLTREGLKDLALKADANVNRTVDLSFANLTVLSMSVGINSGKLFFNLDPRIRIKNADIAGIPDVDLRGLKVYADKVEVGSVSLASSLNALKFDLGPVGISLSRFGIGYADGFSLDLNGAAAFEDLARGSAHLIIDRSGLKVDEIAVSLRKPGITMDGGLRWASSKFAADVDLGVAAMFSFKAALELGKQGVGDAKFSYWRAALTLPSGNIPLAPLPLSIYSVGGGLAYRMKSLVSDGVVSFAPDASSSYVLTAASKLGTSDQGYTWHGDFDLNIDPSNFVLSITGQSYLMSPKEEKPQDKKITAAITLGASPLMMHMTGGVRLKEKAGDITIYDINSGSTGLDMLFSPGDWHVYVGTKANKLTLSAIEGVFKGKGYFMLDSTGLLIGVSQEFDIYKSWACFYGALYGGASLDLGVGVRPVYIDAEGKIWIGIDAGVKAAGERYSIINAYALLGMRMRVPNPAFFYIKGKFHYSFCRGLVEGTWKKTFWLVGDSSDDNAEAWRTMPLISFVTPDTGSTDVSRLPELLVSTPLPHNTPVDIGEDLPATLKVMDVLVYKSSASRPALFAHSGGPLNGETEAVYIPQNFLEPNTVYKMYVKVGLFFGAAAEPHRVEEKEVTFTTTAKGAVGVTDIISGVYPNPNAGTVFADTQIKVYYRCNPSGLQTYFPHTIQLVDALGQNIPLSTTTGQLNSGYEVTSNGIERWVQYYTPTRPMVALQHKNEYQVRIVNPSGEVLLRSKFLVPEPDDAATARQVISASPYPMYASVVHAGTSSSSLASYANSPQEVVFSFATDAPLNWDSVDLVFTLTLKDKTMTVAKTVKQGQYVLLSDPRYTAHVVKFNPMAFMITPQERAVYQKAMPVEPWNFTSRNVRDNTAALDVVLRERKTSCRFVGMTTQQECDDSASQSLTSWRFKYNEGNRSCASSPEGVTCRTWASFWTMN